MNAECEVKHDLAAATPSADSLADSASPQGAPPTESLPISGDVTETRETTEAEGEVEYFVVPALQFRGHTIELEQSKYFHLPDGSPGANYWPAAISLAHFVTDAEGGALAGKRLVELGAGLGTTGLCLATQGADVTMTDQEVVVNIGGTRRNTESNVLRWAGDRPLAARAVPMGWGEEGWAHASVELIGDREPFDYVIGSEIVYEESVHELLAFTLKQLMPTPSTVAYFGFRPRFLSDRYAWKKEEESLRGEEIGGEIGGGWKFGRDGDR